MAIEWMIKMKIGTKLYFSYLLLVVLILIISSLSFRYISQHYLVQETRERLREDAALMSNWLKPDPLTSDNIRAKLRNKVKLSAVSKLLTTQVIVLTPKQEVLFTNLDEATLEDIRESEREYISESVPILGESGERKGFVVLVAKVEDVQELNGMMKQSQRVGFVFSSIIALLICLVFQRKITGPIRKLTEHMRKFSLKGEVEPLAIDTNDEVKELADSFEALTKKLRNYDSQQKLFFQNASHELKTPLMAIQGNAEGILDGVVKGDDVKDSLHIIVNESQRLKKLVDQISYLTKLENVEDTFRFSSIKIGVLLEDAIDSVQALAKQNGISLVLESNAAGSYDLDGEKLKQAFINLLGNGIRYAKTNVTIQSMEVASKLVIEFRDDGKGFSPGEENKVFERFYSGESDGSGIGLAITKTIVEGHGGEITAERNVPSGVVFRILLPIR
ncbi:cell wall metabolism sensor histidine kinase WalK [Bacillus sp. THAF10]|uniref:sensor histidine kinase n=1 Tax=Bacillus sp. THAF10 TaxID=2587848 RepID=UPI001561C09F|nr:HAMP domain-containing sensor histidine kinase [Bacillus sp. THAF10]